MKSVLSIDDKIFEKIKEYPKIRFGLLLITFIGMALYLMSIQGGLGWSLGGVLILFAMTFGSGIVIKPLNSSLTDKISLGIEYAWSLIGIFSTIAITEEVTRFESILIWSLYCVSNFVVWSSHQESQTVSD